MTASCQRRFARAGSGADDDDPASRRGGRVEAGDRLAVEMKSLGRDVAGDPFLAQAGGRASSVIGWLPPGPAAPDRGGRSRLVQRAERA
ncbi:hypothetical protein ACFPM0_28095 [Pseudonocardia sulfidoxydans]|uniref:hypothetical protein n=1 Tax=Pseudonocardia sulfidoxydans TaxID=54011 RepID=UPI00360A1C27